MNATSGSKAPTRARVHHGIHHSVAVRTSSPIFAVVWRLWREWQALKARLLENPTTKRRYKIVNRAALALPVLTGLLTGGGWSGSGLAVLLICWIHRSLVSETSLKYSEEVLPLEISGSASVI